MKFEGKRFSYCVNFEMHVFSPGGSCSRINNSTIIPQKFLTISLLNTCAMKEKKVYKTQKAKTSP